MKEQESTFANRLQMLRKLHKMNQTEFANFLDIPQPTLSAYETGRNTPNMDALLHISAICNISLDWLCGLTNNHNSYNTLSDFADFFYSISELNEIGGEIEINDKFFNDKETDENKWYARLTFYGRDKKYKYNSDVCNMLKEIQNTLLDFKSYSTSKDIYELSKEKTKEYYSKLPLTKKEVPDLSREELQKKHIEYLKLKYPDEK